MIRDFFIFNQVQNTVNVHVTYANNTPIDFSNTDISMYISKDPFSNTDLELTSNNEMAIVNATNGDLSIVFTPNLQMSMNQTSVQYQMTSTANSVSYTTMTGKMYVTPKL